MERGTPAVAGVLTGCDAASAEQTTHSLRPQAGEVPAMSAFLNGFRRAVERRVVQRATQSRNFGGGGSLEETKSMRDMWKKSSIYTTPAVYLMMVVIGIPGLLGSHSHEDGPKYSYAKIRTKPYPWSNSDCNLMDMHCHKHAEGD